MLPSASCKLEEQSGSALSALFGEDQAGVCWSDALVTQKKAIIEPPTIVNRCQQGAWTHRPGSLLPHEGPSNGAWNAKSKIGKPQGMMVSRLEVMYMTTMAKQTTNQSLALSLRSQLFGRQIYCFGIVDELPNAVRSYDSKEPQDDCSGYDEVIQENKVVCHRINDLEKPSCSWMKAGGQRPW